MARCRVVSVATAAAITWRLGGDNGDDDDGGDDDGGGSGGGGGDDDDNGGGRVVGTDDPEGVEVRTEEEQRVGAEVTSLSTVLLPTALYSGRTLSCEVGGHPSLRQHQERRRLLLPSLGMLSPGSVRLPRPTPSVPGIPRACFC